MFIVTMSRKMAADKRVEAWMDVQLSVFKWISLLFYFG